MRELKDSAGRVWRTVAVPTPVAHVRVGARLAFVPASEPDAEPLLTDVTFNSPAAAEGAVEHMSQRELLRRLSLASKKKPGLLNDPARIAPPAIGRGE
ncbi:MAG TPA: hypothetical protein VFX29_06010 [Longimicrobiaceae bacterium]|jgi:hypothetical protein|nr:hypothetical protein [Longimicrobiaceae bacterium]